LPSVQKAGKNYRALAKTDAYMRTSVPRLENSRGKYLKYYVFPGPPQPRAGRGSSQSAEGASLSWRALLRESL